MLIPPFLSLTCFEPIARVTLYLIDEKYFVLGDTRYIFLWCSVTHPSATDLKA